MKTIITSALLALPLVAMAQSKVIENPLYGSKSVFTENISIERIEVKKDTTKISMASYMPIAEYWAQISGDTYIVANGQKLPILKAEGITLNEPYYAPSKDEHIRRFTLYFPEIGKDVESIDFIESDCPQCFKFWGVAVTEKQSARLKAEKEASAKAMEQAMAVKDDGKSLSEPKMMVGKSTLKGKFLNYNKDIFGGLTLKILCYSNNPFTGAQELYHAMLSEEGTFEIEMPLVLENQTIGLQATPINTIFVARCNGTEEIIIDLNAMTSATGFWYFKGDNEDLNNSIAKIEKQRTAFKHDDVMKFRGTSTADFKAHIYALGKEMTEEVAAMDVPVKAKEYFSILSRGRMATCLNMATYNMEIAYRQANNLGYDAPLEGYQAPETDAEFNKFYQELKLNDMDMLYSNDYFSIPRSVMMGLCPQITIVEIIEGMRALGKLDENGEKVLSIIKATIAEGRTATEEENKLVSPFIEKYLVNNPETDEYVYAYRKSVAEKAIGATEGLVFDLNKVQEICSGFESRTPASEAQIAQLEKMGNSAYAEYAKMRSAEIRAEIEAMKARGGYYIHQSNETEADALLVDIVKDHVGKVVFIDLWATWCGPCKRGIEMMKPLEADLEARGVDFVYVTDESSPEDLWNNTIVDMKGSHYRLQSAVLNKLKEKFNFNGIPSYIFINKKGEVAHTQVGFGGTESIVGKLNELLAE